MDRFLPAIFILALCSSCQIYQTNLLRSDINGTHKQPFTFENDTLRISYSFSNRTGDISIFNKSDKPLYVDWARSSLVKNGIAEPYWIWGEEPLPNFILPKTTITTSPFILPDIFDPPFSGTKTYTRESTPMKFQSYIFVSFNEDLFRDFQFDNEFWLAETSQSKQAMPLSMRPDVYTISSLTKGGDAAVAVVILAVTFAFLGMSASGAAQP